MWRYSQPARRTCCSKSAHQARAAVAAEEEPEVELEVMAGGTLAEVAVAMAAVVVAVAVAAAAAVGTAASTLGTEAAPQVRAAWVEDSLAVTVRPQLADTGSTG